MSKENITDASCDAELTESTLIISGSSKRKLDIEDECTDVKPNKELRLDKSILDRFEENNEGEYYFENGLRKVYPYYYTYKTYCKGRWIGKRLQDVFAKEFHLFDTEYYEKNIKCGLLKVNGKTINTDYLLKDNDLIIHMVHRHEVAVLATPIKIIHSDKDLVVVDKPPSIPVHPCGRYRYNSLLSILSKEYDLRDLHTIHRLDRLTSGVLIMTKTLKKSQEMDELVRSRQMDKEYLCRVEGIFPDGTITCCEPIEVLSPKIGVSIVSSSGKECKTEFQKLSHNGKSSLVLCKPHTGRMHQIRVHLQYLGFPIVNDPIYNHESTFGPKKGKGGETGKSREKLLSDLMEVHNLEQWLKCTENEGNVEKTKDNEVLKKILNYNMNSKEYQEMMDKYGKDSAKIKIDPSCHFCQNKYKDPEPKDLLLFLHAHKYRTESWEFQTDLPIWATDSWTDM